MARIRSIKPEFWTDGNIVQLSPWARLLYMGMWNFALCDSGHLPDDPMGLKLKILPADAVDPDELLGELLTLGRVIRRRNEDGRTFLHILRFTDHQKVDTRWNSKCPYCSAESVEVPAEAPAEASWDGDLAPPSASNGANPDDPTPARRDSSEAQRASPELPKPHAGDGGSPPNSSKEGIGEERIGEEKRTSAIAARSADTSNLRADVERLCAHLATRIAENTGDPPPRVSQRWRDAARLMIDKDGRTENEIHAAINWCQDHEFWRTNILSMPKLREQWTQMSMQARRRPQAHTASLDRRQQATDDMFDRALDRARRLDALEASGDP